MRKILVLLICMAFVGCSVLQNSTSSGLAVQYATLKYIDRSDDKVARAARVIDIAEEAKTFFDNKTLPISQVKKLVRAKIKWSDLDTADTLMINALINNVELELLAKRGASLENTATGSQVLHWIITGAQMAL